MTEADARTSFGPGPVKALEKFLEIAKRDGYGKPRMSTIMPVTLPLVKGKKSLIFAIWTSSLQVVAGRRIHTNQKLSMASSMRGSSDDKGPTMACYYGLRIIKDLGLPCF